MFASMQLDGKIISVPFATNNAAVFYRPSLFQEAGITEVPKTWLELQQIAKKLTQDKNGDNRLDQHGIFLKMNGRFLLGCLLSIVQGESFLREECQI